MNRIKAFLENIKIVRCVKRFFKSVSAETYYQEKARKPYWKEFYDNLLWSLRFREVNTKYTAYGLDIINAFSTDYLDEKSFVRSKRRMNGIRGKKINLRNQTILVEDKFVFYCFLKGLNIPTSECFAVSINGKLEFLTGNSENCLFRDSHSFFAKKCISGQGKDVRCISSNDELASLKRDWGNDKYILQEAVQQNTTLSMFYENSVNTIRLVTVHDGERARPLKAVLRCGTHISGKVDNVHSGGIAVGIQANGRLMEYGYFDSSHGTKTDRHPDTGIKFKEFVIPFYDEAVEAALKLHEKLEGLCSLGWDIAITEQGPVFIECNAEWGLAVMQMCHGGIRKEWLELCQKRGIKIPK